MNVIIIKITFLSFRHHSDITNYTNRSDSSKLINTQVDDSRASIREKTARMVERDRIITRYDVYN